MPIHRCKKRPWYIGFRGNFTNFVAGSVLCNSGHWIKKYLRFYLMYTFLPIVQSDHLKMTPKVSHFFTLFRSCFDTWFIHCWSPLYEAYKDTKRDPWYNSYASYNIENQHCTKQGCMIPYWLKAWFVEHWYRTPLLHTILIFQRCTYKAKWLCTALKRVQRCTILSCTMSTLYEVPLYSATPISRFPEIVA